MAHRCCLPHSISYFSHKHVLPHYNWKKTNDEAHLPLPLTRVRLCKEYGCCKAVRKSADINAPAFSEGFYCHLDFLIFLDKDLRIRKCKDILFPLTEIYGSVCILQDKMIFMLFPVVFIGIKIKSSFFLYTKDVIQLEEFSCH